MNLRAITGYTLIILSTFCTASERKDFNSEIMTTVEWLAKNKQGLGYDLHSRYTENIKYGAYTFRATGEKNKTMCVAAVFEVIIRSLASAKLNDGTFVHSKLMPGNVLSGASALNLSPYIFQYESNAIFPDYKRKYSAGAGDAFVLFGIGRYVEFSNAKPGDFIYFNRAKSGGHATVFISFLDRYGKVTNTSEEAIGFRYFSAQQGGTQGLGYRDAYFDICPSVTSEYKADCPVIRSQKRTLFSVSRLYSPDEWAPKYSAIRIKRFFDGESIDSIFNTEAAFRGRATADLEKANKEAAKAAQKGLFPVIIPKIAADASAAESSLRALQFNQSEFGQDFDE